MNTTINIHFSINVSIIDLWLFGRMKTYLCQWRISQ